MSHAPSTVNPSSQTRPPLHLPNGILQRIAQLADDEDFPALRSTSRIFRDETEIQFADAFFTNVYYPATPEGLERLTKIAEHPLFSLKVRNYIGTTKQVLVKYGAHQIEEVLKSVALAMWGNKNLGVLLVDDRSQRNQNSAAVRYADNLARPSPDNFIVDVQCSTSSPSDERTIFQCLRYVEKGIRFCPFVVRFLHAKTRNSPVAQATIEAKYYRPHKFTYTGSHDYFVLTRPLVGENQLVEIEFSQWRVSRSDSRDSLQHIVEHQSRSLLRLVIRDAHITSSWKHKELVEAIMLCQLDYCHLSNLTSSGDGVEFLGTFEASGVDEIKAGLMDMKWTSKIGEEVVEIA
ncbi:hypothetical protein KCU64_g9548, partial [Aureobasidium melanogenum]